jgi:hypothetical protein
MNRKLSQLCGLVVVEIDINKLNMDMQLFQNRLKMIFIEPVKKKKTEPLMILKSL